MKKALALIVFLLALCGPQTASAYLGDCTIDPAWSGQLQPLLETQVIQLVNAHRQAMGLNALVVAPVLMKIAEYKSMNMSGYMYMQHDDPAPIARPISDRFAACGYPTNAAWGENIAYGLQTAQDVENAFLSDIGHRQNIENSSWTTIGVGVVLASNGLLFWTEDFGTTGAITAPPPDPAPVPDPTPDPTPPPVIPPPPVVPPVVVPGQQWMNRTTGRVMVVDQVVSRVVWFHRVGDAPNTRHTSLSAFKRQFVQV